MVDWRHLRNAKDGGCLKQRTKQPASKAYRIYRFSVSERQKLLGPRLSASAKQPSTKYTGLKKLKKKQPWRMSSTGPTPERARLEARGGIDLGARTSHHTGGPLSFLRLLSYLGRLLRDFDGPFILSLATSRHFWRVLMLQVAREIRRL